MFERMKSGECGACEAPRSAHVNVGGWLLCPPADAPVVRTPQEYDGFLTPVGGAWEVSAGGAVVGVFEDIDAARAVLGEHCTDRPMWLVGIDGGAMAL